MDQMKNQAIVCSIRSLRQHRSIFAEDVRIFGGRRSKPRVDHIIWPDGKRIILLAKGRLVNLNAGTGLASCDEFQRRQTLAQIWNLAEPNRITKSVRFTCLPPKHPGRKGERAALRHKTGRDAHRAD